MRTVVRILIVLLVLSGMGVGGYFWWRSRQTDAQPSYKTVPVRRTDIVSTISATGTIVPEDVVDVGAQVNGPIDSFGVDKDGRAVDYRSKVDEGMLLARIDDSIYAADLATSSAQLAEAHAQVRLSEANLTQARAKQQQAERDWQRAQRLEKSKALSQADHDAAESGYEQARAAVAVAEASIAQAQASVAIAEASVRRSTRNVDYCKINSPVSGVIIDKRVEIGQTVVASFNAPSLFLIAKDLTRMQVLVQVNEADIGHVQPGQKVTFTTDAYPGEPFKGEVRKVRLNATMTQNVVTYTVEIATDNADLRLLPYLTANVRFVIAKSEGVLAVPTAALRFTPSSTDGAQPVSDPGGAGKPRRDPAPDIQTVWVLNGGQPRQMKVRVGISDGSLTEVQSDELTEDAPVIIADVSPSASKSAAQPAGSNPFAPPMMGGRRNR